MYRLAPSLAGLVLAATPAVADVTPREIWDDWVSAAEEGDARITTESVEESDGRVVVRGVSVSAGTEEEGRYSVEIDEITLVQNDDGTVSVIASPEYPIVLTDVDDEGARRETRLMMRHPDLAMTVSEEAGVRTHSFAGPEVALSIEEVVSGGESVDVSGGAVVTDVIGRYDVRETAAGESALSASRIEVDFAGTDPADDGTFDLNLAMQGIESNNMLQLVGPGTPDLSRNLPEGESLDGSFRADSTAFSLDTESEGETVVLSGASGPAETEVSVSSQGLAYASESVDAALSVSGSSIPLPEVALDIGSASSSLAVPLLASEEAQPFTFSVSMLDVALDEGLWNMVDPAAVLPRDPGAVVIDVGGEMMVDDDMDAAGMGEGISGEVETLTLNSVRLAIADAELLATGELDLVDSAAGEAMPVGEIDVMLSGATLLLQRLVQAGILPEEQAMSAQMMLGMFAEPGAGDDEMVSRIRLLEGGGITINDHQVR